jgi:hypothetical protein
MISAEDSRLGVKTESMQKRLTPCVENRKLINTYFQTLNRSLVCRPDKKLKKFVTEWHWTLMIGKEIFPETSVIFNKLTWLVA